MLKASDALRDRGTLLLNAGAIDDRLREQDCRANVIHVAPTRSMLADALAQYLVWKQWKRWLFVVGSHEQDKLYADALRRAATRFGAKIVQERVFEDTGGARRTDSGVTLIQRQMPVFTQQAPAYDVLVAADESDVFAAYLPYRTWDPRPVAGSAGLVPTSWHAAQDQWGAVQIQNRFLKLNSRPMTALDMQAWTAARMIGEAASRTKSGDTKAVSDFLKGPGLFHRRVQGPEADAAGLEPAASPADPAGRWPHGGLGVAAGRISCIRCRSSTRSASIGRNQMQAAMKVGWIAHVASLAAFRNGRLACDRGPRRGLYRLCVQREEQHGHGHRYRHLDRHKDHQGRPAAARHRVHARRQVVFVAVGDDDSIQVIDVAKQEVVDTLPSGPDPELFALDADGKILYVANENDNTVTIIDVEKRARLGDVQVGVEPEGMAISPDGKILINTSETTNMAHFIDTATRQIVANVLVDARPRFAEFKRDGSELWVSSEIGGTVSIIDPVKREVTDKIEFNIPGLRSEAIQPVGIGMTRDGKTAFVALGPANRVAVVDAASHKVTNICWSASGSGTWRSPPMKNICWSPMACRTTSR